MQDLITITNTIIRHIHREKAEDYKRNVIALLVGTAAAESDGRHLIQKSVSVARSFWQVEPFTAVDVWNRYVSKSTKQIPLTRITKICGVQNFRSLVDDESGIIRWVLTYNIAFACVTARLVYLFKPQAIPNRNDVQGLAEYWKHHYNTKLGAGTPEHFMAMWKKHDLSKFLCD